MTASRWVITGLIAIGISSAAIPAEIPETITLNQEQIMAIQEQIGIMSAQIENESSLKWYWFDAYRELKQCIRETQKQGKAAGTCIGDMEV